MAASPAVTAVKPITKKNGRPPSLRTPELAEAIFTRLVAGDSVRSITESEGMPSAPAFYDWLNADPEFAKLYARGKEIQAEKLADEIMEIADDSTNDFMENKDGVEYCDHENIQRSRLRVEARKWVAAKLLPKKYGERANETHVTTVTNNNLILLDESRLIELQERRQKQLAELTQ